jgi:transposase
MKENELSMKIIHPYAAGIDIGSKTHWVAVDQVPGNVKEFGVYTRDHQRLIEHLKSHQISTVAMESTGSYWQTLFHALQKAGFEVILVQGSQTRNVQGKKTDILDCMWIQKLHSLGLLSSSFLLSDYLQTLRTYYAHREHLVEQTVHCYLPITNGQIYQQNAESLTFDEYPIGCSHPRSNRKIRQVHP